jgi:3-methyladenine DNA glycosylase/8-oxoguanine DNA glycosylase
VPSPLSFPLVGPGGEPVDLWRTVVSHGMSDLPPFDVDESARTVRVTLSVEGLGARTVALEVGDHGRAIVHVVGSRTPTGRNADRLIGAVRHVLRMDEDLSGFYARIADDPALSWASSGAGRMIRGQTVFEDVVKTICTTNCTWAATQRMVRALVEHLGDPAPGAPAGGWLGRTFPSPAAMAASDERFYRDVVRAGYRGPYLIEVARSVADGGLDLESLGPSAPDPVPDDEVERTLLALPGVGPYAAANVMMTLGRHSRLILDSWTRPTYAKLVGRSASPSDGAIRRRFARYREHAGLAFWLFLTKDWVEEPPPDL